MPMHRASAPIFIVVATILALTVTLFAQYGVALAQGATPTPMEEAYPTPAPTEEAVPTVAAPTAAPTQAPAPAQVAPTTAPAQEAAPAEAAPTTLPTTGVAANPLTIFAVIIGTVAALGVVSGISALRKRKP